MDAIRAASPARQSNCSRTREKSITDSDPEKQASITSSSSQDLEDADDPPPVDPFESKARHLPLHKLFIFFFYHIGMFGFGGSAPQINIMRDKFVVEEQWISLERFQKVFALYQVIPGPESAEMCMFFGVLSRGWIGGVFAGLGFILPGFLLMLIASYLYVVVDVSNMYISASLRGMKCVVAALIFRATHILAENIMRNPKSRKVNPVVLAAAIFTAINSALRINIFISLFLYAIINTLVFYRLHLVAAALFIIQYIVYAVYVVFKGIPSAFSLGLGLAPTPTLPRLFVLGLVSGSLSFGGAYTAIPLIQVEAVVLGGWMTLGAFVDCIAITSLLPAPVVIFATFVGFQGGYYNGGDEANIARGFAGAIIITVGMFLPCFIFTIAGHKLLEKIMRMEFLTAFFEGLCGAVIGVIAIVALQILNNAVGTVVSSANGKQLSAEALAKVAGYPASAAVVYVVSLVVLYKFGRNKFTAVITILCGAVAGQYLFVTPEQ